MSRASTFEQSVADIICERIGQGESLRSVCDDDELPAMSTVFKWLGANKEFAEQYTRAREAQADALFDEILVIADTPLIGEKTKTLPDGKVETTSGDMIEHRRLQVDARKWMAGKLRPKKYGDKIELSGDPENPVVHEIVNRIVDPQR